MSLSGKAWCDKKLLLAQVFHILSRIDAFNMSTNDKNKQLYDDVEKQLRGMVVAFTPANSCPSVFNKSSVQEKTPLAALEIPNKLYWLWNRKRKLSKELGINIPKRIEMLNQRIGGAIKVINSSRVEMRLQREISK